jgi:Domain of unknown function (DUF6968)
MSIASRILKLRTAESEAEIAIRIFAPEIEKPGAWGCRYEVDWPEGTHAMTIWGFDAMQALFPALQTIGAEIYASDYHKSGNLFWDVPGKGYGFPVVPTLRDLLQGDDAKYF